MGEGGDVGGHLRFVFFFPWSGGFKDWGWEMGCGQGRCWRLVTLVFHWISPVDESYKGVDQGFCLMNRRIFMNPTPLPPPNNTPVATSFSAIESKVSKLLSNDVSLSS